MNEIIIDNPGNGSVSEDEVRSALYRALEGRKLNKVLIIPPDFTRINSQAGMITRILYELLSPSSEVDILPATGTHRPLSDLERKKMFGDEIPKERFLVHDWEKGTKKIGEVSAEFIEQVTQGALSFPINVEISKHIANKAYDLIISIGQVVPHEIVGMASYTKNILVGCGGKDVIDKSHFIGAVHGMERIMGIDRTPVRQVFDFVEEKFLKEYPIMYVMTVTTTKGGAVNLDGLFIGRSRKIFEKAVALSQKKNIEFLERPVKKVVVYLDDKKYRSTWIGNKAIYRTRMAIQDGGELIILAPGIERFGENDIGEELIRKYGYAGMQKILKLIHQDVKLKENLAIAAHLIHGSSEGRFTITYAVEKLKEEEIRKVNYNYLPFKKAYKIYNPDILNPGFNTLPNGEEVFFVSDPALGLWAWKEKFNKNFTITEGVN
ncbi:lactate racemase domain-containing protein [Thermovorax subterraneus]|nr:lactate racemase domain-containing protein [Thermovorax subterraneus]